MFVLLFQKQELNKLTRFYSFHRNLVNHFHVVFLTFETWHNILGVLNGFVWQHIATLPGTKWEHPDINAIGVIVDRPPTCIPELSKIITFYCWSKGKTHTKKYVFLVVEPLGLGTPSDLYKAVVVHIFSIFLYIFSFDKIKDSFSYRGSYFNIFLC